VRAARSSRTMWTGCCLTSSITTCAGADRADRSCAEADGLEVLLGVVVQIRFQLRLPCVVPAGRSEGGKTIYNFRERKIGPQTYTVSGHSVF
jgi:hypothetical protein